MIGKLAPPYHTLFTGRFAPTEVSVQWEDSPPALAAELQAAIDAAWEGLKPNPHFNGRIARLEEWGIEGGALRLRLCPSEYKHLLYSNAHASEIISSWGEEQLARALGISVVVVSADGRILLMERSDQVGEYPGCYDLFGGHINPPAPGEIPDVFASMEKELVEELALPPGTAAMSLFGLLLTWETRKPELLFTARCGMESGAMMRAARAARDRYEYRRLLTLPADAGSINRFLECCRAKISPSAFGGLEIFSGIR